MGAHLKVHGRTAILRGVQALQGTDVWVHRDNRAGAALVLAGLAAQGTTVIHDDEELISRGYSRLVEDLQTLGARIVHQDQSDG